MKYIEKAMQINSDLSKEEILQMCPTDFKIMKYKCETFADYCDECWNREMPEVFELIETDEKKKTFNCTIRLYVINKLLNNEYLNNRLKKKK